MKKMVVGVLVALFAGTVSARGYEIISGNRFEELTHDISFQDDKGDWWVKNRDTWYSNTKINQKYPDLKCTNFEGKVLCMKIR